jgi:hypothetical protein
VDEGMPTLARQREECAALNFGYLLMASDPFWAVASALSGHIAQGLRIIRRGIRRADTDRYCSFADWYRLFLCEIFLEILTGKEKLPLHVMLWNFPILAYVILVAAPRIPALVARIRQNPQYDPNGYHICRAETILGLFYKAKRKREPALKHLGEARQIAIAFGETPMLAKIDTALAELRDRKFQKGAKPGYVS